MHAILINSLLVGAGGFVGSVARYLLALALPAQPFPAGTLAANVLGCFAIGALAQLVTPVSHLSPEARLLLATGFCGGFTTMSSLIFETAQFLKVGAYLHAGAYVLASFAGSLLAFGLGALLVRGLMRAA